MPDFNQLLELIKAQYLSYGYLIVFLAAYFEFVILLGYIWPGGTIIIIGITYSIDGRLSFPLLALLVVLGAVLGNLTSYLLGRQGIMRPIEKSRFFPRFAPYLERASKFMTRYGPHSVFLSQFVGYARPFVMVLAGTVRMSLPQFLLYQIPGAIIWNLFFCGLAFLLAKTLNVESLVSGIGLTVAVLVILAYFGYRFFLHRKNALPPKPGDIEKD